MRAGSARLATRRDAGYSPQVQDLSAGGIIPAGDDTFQPAMPLFRTPLRSRSADNYPQNQAVLLLYLENGPQEPGRRRKLLQISFVAKKPEVLDECRLFQEVNGMSKRPIKTLLQENRLFHPPLWPNCDQNRFTLFGVIGGYRLTKAGVGGIIPPSGL